MEDIVGLSVRADVAARLASSDALRMVGATDAGHLLVRSSGNLVQVLHLRTTGQGSGVAPLCNVRPPSSLRCWSAAMRGSATVDVAVVDESGEIFVVGVPAGPPPVLPPARALAAGAAVARERGVRLIACCACGDGLLLLVTAGLLDGAVARVLRLEASGSYAVAATARIDGLEDELVTALSLSAVDTARALRGARADAAACSALWAVAGDDGGGVSAFQILIEDGGRRISVAPAWARRRIAPCAIEGVHFSASARAAATVCADGTLRIAAEHHCRTLSHNVQHMSCSDAGALHYLPSEGRAVLRAKLSAGAGGGAPPPADAFVVPDGAAPPFLLSGRFALHSGASFAAGALSPTDGGGGDALEQIGEAWQRLEAIEAETRACEDGLRALQSALARTAPGKAAPLALRGWAARDLGGGSRLAVWVSAAPRERAPRGGGPGLWDGWTAELRSGGDVVFRAKLAKQWIESAGMYLLRLEMPSRRPLSLDARLCLPLPRRGAASLPLGAVRLDAIDISTAPERPLRSAAQLRSKRPAHRLLHFCVKSEAAARAVMRAHASRAADALPRNLRAAAASEGAPLDRLALAIAAAPKGAAPPWAPFGAAAAPAPMASDAAAAGGGGFSGDCGARGRYIVGAGAAGKPHGALERVGVGAEGVSGWASGWDEAEESLAERWARWAKGAEAAAVKAQAAVTMRVDASTEELAKEVVDAIALRVEALGAARKGEVDGELVYYLGAA